MDLFNVSKQRHVIYDFTLLRFVYKTAGENRAIHLQFFIWKLKGTWLVGVNIYFIDGYCVFESENSYSRKGVKK